ncbi:dicarboxylate/amino acid:cation symporter [Clostridium tetani]|uniref:dicarboxylate/amino acid:cation symporter n=1 Tax=Clostridium tetani TaxID=1513 RepID=UPI0038B401AD
MKNITAQAGTANSTNLLLVIVNIIPSNITSVFSNNSNILAVVTGLCINILGNKIKMLRNLLEYINSIITVFLSFVTTQFTPIAIFVAVGVSLNPIKFVKKIGKVALFGFSTSSSVATLPLNTKTTIEELGVNEDIASFILPLEITINMNGTTIMQVISTIFIATTADYNVTTGNIIIISLIALIASIGTPAALGAGAIIFFIVLSGMGYNNDGAILAYSLILAINIPIRNACNVFKCSRRCSNKCCSCKI